MSLGSGSRFVAAEVFGLTEYGKICKLFKYELFIVCIVFSKSFSFSDGKPTITSVVIEA